MRRRCNADDRLRKLERASASRDPEDIATYWRACIKAGKLPKHTLIDEADNAIFGIWTLWPAAYEQDYKITPRVLDFRLDEDWFPTLERRGFGYTTETYSEATAVDWLEEMIQLYDEENYAPPT